MDVLFLCPLSFDRLRSEVTAPFGEPLDTLLNYSKLCVLSDSTILTNWKFSSITYRG